MVDSEIWTDLTIFQGKTTNDNPLANSSIQPLPRLLLFNYIQRVSLPGLNELVRDVG